MLVLSLKRLVWFIVMAVALTPRMAAAPPNILLILGEGHGWSSTSVPMDDRDPLSRNARVRTPHFERLAAQGLRFANFYAASPRCTPSRAALLTGQSPAQLHMTFINEGKRDDGQNLLGPVLAPSASMELPASATTLPEILARAGYATAHFGKWHLGRASPSQHGFAENDGANDNGGPDHVANPHPQQLDAMTERGLDFMARQVKLGRPFYLQLSHYASRQGGAARPSSLATVKNWSAAMNEREIAEAAAMLDLDTAFGRLLEKIDELGIATNTYVLFTTDHGTPGRNAPLAGGKGTVSDGGLRVPLLIRGPGVQPGSCSRVRVTGVDILPTIAALARVTEPLPKGSEGGSFAAQLTNPSVCEILRPREEFVVHFPHYDKDARGPASALYLGEFKFIRFYGTHSRQLFHLTTDPAERRDLAQERPDLVSALDQRLTRYLQEVQAQMPVPNPNYNNPGSTTPPSPNRGKEKKKPQ